MTKKQVNTAYFDCFSGAAGDMFLGALLDAGLPREELQDQLAALAVTGFRLHVEKKISASISATRVTIEMAGDQPHRSWRAIQTLLAESDLPEPVRDKSHRIFRLLAEAEGKIHNCPPEEVHFHEVGGLDAIIDIVGTVIGLEWLGVEKIYCSPLPMPSGWVRCRHGDLPLPAPAVCELLAGVPVYGVELRQELLTPTAAAIIRGLAAEFGPMPPMTITSTGYGAGSRDSADGRPNLLRIFTGRQYQVAEALAIEVIETNIDDYAPEGFPFLYEKLFDQGALDVLLIPVHMKKGRPGFLLQVLCDPVNGPAVKQTILSETTAIGLRFRREHRQILPRRYGSVVTRWGRVEVKEVATPVGPALYPEYEDCRRLAVEHGIPLKNVYAAVSQVNSQDFREND